MTLIYVSVNAYPSERANFVQISDFVSELSRQTRVIFIVPMDKARMTPAEHARLANTQVVPVPMSGPAKYLGIALALLRHGRRADHVYTRSPKAALMAARLSRAPITVELHETPGAALRAKLAAQPRIDLVSISEMLKDTLAAAGQPRVSYMPLSASGWEIPKDIAPKYDVAYAGSAAPGKGVERLIEAARARPDLSFLLICKMSPEMAADLPDNITTTGFLSHDAVGPRLAEARFLAAPYEKKIFGADGKVDISGSMSPLKIFEYMNIGRPILAADIPAVRALLGDRGLYFEPGSTEGFLAAIDRADQAPADLGPGLHALWRDRYSTEARARRLLESWQT